MFNKKLDDIVEQMEQAYYEAPEIFFTDPDWHFPSRSAIVNIIKSLRRLMFPRYFGPEAPCESGPKYFIGDMMTQIEVQLREQVIEALKFRDGKTMSDVQINERASEICSNFFYSLPHLHEMLLKDVQAAYDGDPAAESKEEIIFSYPGFYAIFVYRIAHEFYVQGVPLIPRIMTEYAHAGTGVDLNAGATVGEYFFIDHATGVVIGETTVIGDHVKIYQGVTLGALSLKAGQKLRGVKRHPTIEDYVTIYSNASVLGGDTVIGKGSVIAGSAFVTESVPPNSRVTLTNQEVTVRVPGAKIG